MASKQVTLRTFEKTLQRDLAKLQSKVKTAIKHAAKSSLFGIRARTPKAFGELRDSMYATDTSIVVSAPHAQAVELGSRPHVVPIEELLAWVKLRGMQGLSRGARQRSSNPKAASYDKRNGPTTREMARRVAGELKRREKGGALDIDAPMQVARAIQHAIAQSGTRPHHFVENSLHDVVMRDLDEQIRHALHD